MAALIPILLPHIIEAGVNIGIGVTNAIQGDSSSVSFQIGNRVFTNKKKFNFGSLPPELRQKIILMAMEGSKDLILPTPYYFDPTQPLTQEQINDINRRGPLNPESKHYRSIVGDRVSANGYPISTWRWAMVCVEWRDVVRAPLWRDLEILGLRPYINLLKKMDSKQGFEVLRHVRSVTLREGFRSAGDIYTILSSPLMESLEVISILPDYPTSFHQLVPPVPTFLFGFQLIRTRKPMRSLTYGFPLESTTNSASRQQLKALRPPKLNLTFDMPTVSLFQELTDAVSETTEVFGIRYLPTRRLVDHQMFLCEPLQSFRKIHLYLNLPRPRSIMIGPPNHRSMEEDPQSPLVLFVTSLISAMEAAEPEVQDRYTIWKVDGWDTPGQVKNATKTRIWPAQVLFSLDFDDDGAAPEQVEEPVAERSETKHWERETNFKLFGGLLNLSLESKKH